MAFKKKRIVTDLYTFKKEKKKKIEGNFRICDLGLGNLKKKKKHEISV